MPRLTRKPQSVIRNIISAASLSGIFGFAWSADSYNVVNLEKLGGTYSSAHAINNSNIIVGMSYISGTSNGAIWQNSGETQTNITNGLSAEFLDINNSGTALGNFAVKLTQAYGLDWHPVISSNNLQTDLGTAGGWQAYARAINDNGAVVGSRSTGSPGYGPDRATLWQGLIATDLGTLGGVSSGAVDINSAGKVVGSSDTGTTWGVGVSISHAFSWVNGEMTDLGTLAGTQFPYDYSMARGINDLDQIIGVSNDHAVMWSGGNILDLGVNFNPTAINNQTEIVGITQYGGRNHAVLWKDGQIIDLNSFLSAQLVASGWFINEAWDINDSGVIVGSIQNLTTGFVNAVALFPTTTAVPEMPSLALFAGGLMLLAGRRWQAGKAGRLH